MIDRNPGCELDLGWINRVNVNLSAVNERAANFNQSRPLKNEYQAAWLLRALTCIDLTTLGGDDTDSNVSRLCYKAAKPLPSDVLVALGFNYDDILQPIRTAAVCVYPSKVDIAVATLKKIGLYHKINVASAQWEKLYQEIQQMKEACGQNAHMKTILAVGELGNLNNVYKASLVAMMAGSDFIKTSTGKESLNATIPFGIVMCRAIREYQRKAGYKVGLKPAGGIRTAKDALAWLVLVREELGKDWCYPDLFRFGASGLLGDIERQLFHYTTKTYAALHEFNMA